MNELYWQQPLWLALLPLPLLAYFWLRARPATSRLAEFIQRHLWPHLISGPSAQARARLPWRPMLIWGLLCLALAGPGILTFDRETAQRSAANLVFIVDISPSMGAQDVAPSRLEQSKKLIADFVQPLDAHRLALIAFSANAYTVLPLSHDHGAFLHFLDSLDPSLVSVTGSNLGRALQLARLALEKGNASDGLVVLISDGEIHDATALDEARRLAAAGHQLHSLAIGTEQGAPVPLAGGRLVKQQGKLHTSQLQRDTLQALAAAGGGSAQDLKPHAWPPIQEKIDQLQQSAYQAEVRRQGGLTLFPFLIGLALLLMFWQGLRQPQGLAVLLCGLLSLQANHSEAAPWDEAKGLKALEKNNYQAALEIYSQLDNYTGRIGRGVAAYELGDWSRAREAFEQAYPLAELDSERARASYNLGNSLTQLGELEAAQQAFQQALVWQPDHTHASRNLALLKRAEQEYSGPKAGDKAQAGSESGDSGADDNIDINESGDAEARGQGAGGEQGQGRMQDAPSAEALQESLKAWSHNPPTAEQASSQAWQQFRNLNEDSQILLMRRFEIEDKRAAGLVESKPW